MKTNSKSKLQEINQKLEAYCKNHFNVLKSCDETVGENNCCSSDDASQGMVDLVLIIDSSSTMAGVVPLVSAGAATAVLSSQNECNADVRDVWLWVDAKEPGSTSSHDLGSTGNFAESHQIYLESIGATGPFFHDIDDNVNNGYQPLEKGAAAIADISAFFDWREGACRSILYISDTKITGYGSNAADNDAALGQAITVANANSVTVFAHRCDPATFISPMSLPEVDEDYHNLCNATGGMAITGGDASVEIYETLTLKAICNCERGCQEVAIPELHPCISISWGDSECDCFETDDVEILCITVCNCYNNVAFDNITIGQIEVTDSDGNPVALLPDGTPSVQVIPPGPFCFGNLEPCENGEKNCVSRQFVIITRGAKNGDYLVKVQGICFDVRFNYVQESCFKLKLCKS